MEDTEKFYVLRASEIVRLDLLILSPERSGGRG